MARGRKKYSDLPLFAWAAHEKKLEYQREYQREYWHKCPEKAAQNKRLYKERHPNAEKDRKRQYRQEHLEEVRQKDRERGRQRHLEDPERIREIGRRWCQTHKEERKRYNKLNAKRIGERNHAYHAQHRDSILTRKRSNYLRNIDRERERHRLYNLSHPHRNKPSEKSRQAQRLWRQNNREKKRASDARRGAQKRNLPCDFTTHDWEVAVNYFGGRCAYCGNAPGLLKGMEFHRDHYIPLSSESPDNPGTVPWNILPACGECNWSKGHHEPNEWIVKRFGKRKASKIRTNILQYFDMLQKHPRLEPTEIDAVLR